MPIINIDNQHNNKQNWSASQNCQLPTLYSIENEFSEQTNSFGHFQFFRLPNIFPHSSKLVLIQSQFNINNNFEGLQFDIMEPDNIKIEMTMPDDEDFSGNQYVSIKSKGTFKLEKYFEKIYSAAPAVNNTICFLGRSNQKDCLVWHSNEKIIQMKIFQRNTWSFAMLSQTQCCVLQTRQNQILVWNLLEKCQKVQEVQIPFEFMYQEADQSFLDIFPQTKYVVVRQQGRYNANILSLKYYKYPLASGQLVNHQAIFNGEEWTYQYVVAPSDKYSQYCWYKPKQQLQKDMLKFSTYSPKPKQLAKPGKYSKRSFRITEKIRGRKEKTNFKVLILHIWKIDNNKYLFVCRDNNSIKENCNYICQKTRVPNKEPSWKMRQARFDFHDFNGLTVDEINIGCGALFRTFNFCQKKRIPSPVYYVDYSAEKIVCQTQWVCSHQVKDRFNGNPNQLIKCQYENKDVKQIKLTVIKLSKLQKGQQKNEERGDESDMKDLEDENFENQGMYPAAQEDNQERQNEGENYMQQYEGENYLQQYEGENYMQQYEGENYLQQYEGENFLQDYEDNELRQYEGERGPAVQLTEYNQLNLQLQQENQDHRVLSSEENNIQEQQILDGHQKFAEKGENHEKNEEEQDRQ